MRKVVVISPWGGRPQALAQTAQYMGALLRRGCDPFSSNVYTNALGFSDLDGEDRTVGRDWGLKKIKEYQEAHIIGEPTAGMRSDIKAAEAAKLQLFKFKDWAEAWERLK